jgi:hypothetical protein
MTDKDSNDFCFDAWVRLAQDDPQAFEAQRTALLGIELSRGTPAQRARGREALMRFEAAAVGCSSAERIEIAGQHMAASLRDMSRALDHAALKLADVYDTSSSR